MTIIIQIISLWLLIVCVSFYLPVTVGFATSFNSKIRITTAIGRGNLNSKLFLSSTKGSSEAETICISLGEGYNDIMLRLQPIYENSKFIQVTHTVPFNLNIERPVKGKGNLPFPIVTKEGVLLDQGELPGDVLRATTAWSQGFNAAGATSDISMFAGNIRWRKSVFDTTGAPWDAIVDALLSNTAERSKTVTLVFERPLDDKDTIA